VSNDPVILSDKDGIIVNPRDDLVQVRLVLLGDDTMTNEEVDEE